MTQECHEDRDRRAGRAAAARSERVELLTLVLNVCWREDAVLLAKQMASVDRLSGGRLTAGLGALEQVGLLAEALDLPPAG